MNINFNPNINSAFSEITANKTEAVKATGNQTDFKKVITKGLNNVNELQSEANTSIVDLLSGKNQDINSVVASVAKADMSFKLLVGVRDKLVEAYKETMKMQA